MKTGLLYGMVANSKTRVRCVFCGVFIPKATKCIEEHTHGVKHKENIEMMSDNGISFDNDVLHCKPCKVELEEEESVSKHIESDEHANWMAALDDLVDGEFVNVDAYLSSEKDDVYCDVCHIDLQCSLPTIEEHVNGFTHRCNTLEKLKPLNGIFPVDNNDEVWCKPCKDYIENTTRSILDHIDFDQNHVEWVADMEDLIDGHDVSIANFLANEFENNAYCNKCHMNILCEFENIESHIHSESHLNQFS